MQSNLKETQRSKQGKSGNLSNTKHRGQELRKYKMDRKWHFFSTTHAEFKGDTNTLTYTVNGKEKTVKLSQEAADNYWKYFRNCTNGYALDYLVEHGFKLNEGTYRVLKLSTRTSTPEEVKSTISDIKQLFTKLLGVCGSGYHESVLKVWKFIDEKILKLSENKNSICSKISIIKDIFFPSVEGVNSLDDVINGKEAKVYVSEYTDDKFKVYIDSDYKTDKLIKYTDNKITDYYAAVICKRMYDDKDKLNITGQILNIIESFLNKGQKKNTANSLFFPVSADSFFKSDIFKVYSLNSKDIKKLYSETNNEMIIENYKVWTPSMVFNWYDPITEKFKDTHLSINELFDTVKTSASAYGYENPNTKALSTCIFYWFNTLPKPVDIDHEYLTRGEGDEGLIGSINSLIDTKKIEKLDEKLYTPLRFCFAGNFTFDLTDLNPMFTEELTPNAWEFLRDKIDDDDEFNDIVRLLNGGEVVVNAKQNEILYRPEHQDPYESDDEQEQEDEVVEEKDEPVVINGRRIEGVPENHMKIINKYLEDHKLKDISQENLETIGNYIKYKVGENDKSKTAAEQKKYRTAKTNWNKEHGRENLGEYAREIYDIIQKEPEQKEGISSRKLRKLGLKNWQVKKIKKIINNRVNETINEALKDKPKAGVTENDTLNEIKEMLKLLVGEDKTQQVERPTTIALTQEPKKPNVKDNRQTINMSDNGKTFNPSDILGQRNKLKPVKHVEKPQTEEHNLKYDIEHFDHNKLNKTMKGLSKILKKGELTQDNISAEGKQKALKILKRVHLNPITANLIKIVGTGANPKTYKGGIFSDLLSFIPGGSAAFNIAKSVYKVAKPLVDKAVNKYDEAYMKQSKGSCRKLGYMNSEQLKKYLVNNNKPKLSELARVLK